MPILTLCPICHHRIEGLAMVVDGEVYHTSCVPGGATPVETPSPRSIWEGWVFTVVPPSFVLDPLENRDTDLIFLSFREEKSPTFPIAFHPDRFHAIVDIFRHGGREFIEVRPNVYGVHKDTALAGFFNYLTGELGMKKVLNPGEVGEINDN